MAGFNAEHKLAHHEKQFPLDLEEARQMGRELVQEQMPQMLRLPGPLPGLRDPVREKDRHPRALRQSGFEVRPGKTGRQDFDDRSEENEVSAHKTARYN